MKLIIELQAAEAVQAEDLLAQLCRKFTEENEPSDSIAKTAKPKTKKQRKSDAAPVEPEQDTAPVSPEPAQATEPPTSAPVEPASAYSPDQLAIAGMQLMDNGKQEDLQKLLLKFGVNSLPELPASAYNGFADALRELGAQI